MGKQAHATQRAGTASGAVLMGSALLMRRHVARVRLRHRAAAPTLVVCAMSKSVRIWQGNPPKLSATPTVLPQRVAKKVLRAMKAHRRVTVLLLQAESSMKAHVTKLDRAASGSRHSTQVSGRKRLAPIRLQIARPVTRPAPWILPRIRALLAVR